MREQYTGQLEAQGGLFFIYFIQSHLQTHFKNYILPLEYTDQVSYMKMKGLLGAFL